MGKLDGRFQREGNIYDVPLLAQYMRDYPRVVTQGKDNVISITSLNARRVNLQSGFNADAQVAKAAFKVCSLRLRCWDLSDNGLTT